MPGMPQAPTNVGPATAAQAHTGNAAAALPKIRNALTMLQEALPSIPMGTPAHSSVLKAVKDIGAHMEELGTPQNQGMDMQSLIQMMRQQSQQAPQQALQRMYPGQPQGGPAMPGMPPGGAPPGGPPPGGGA